MDRVRDEARLLRRLRDGDGAAFREMVLANQHRVFNLVYRMLGNEQEAEDVAQDVFLTFFKTLDSFRAECSISTWLLRIAANSCKNRLKYLGRRHNGESLDDIGEERLSAEPLGEPVPRPDRQSEGLEMERAIQREMAALDEEQRTVILLRDVEGLSYQDIQKITGLADGTVKSRLHRARQALKSRLAAFVGGGRAKGTEETDESA